MNDPTIPGRVIALEDDVRRIKAQLEKHDRLLEHALPQMQERIDHLEAVLIDENENTRKAIRETQAELRDQMARDSERLRGDLGLMIAQIPVCKGKG